MDAANVNIILFAVALASLVILGSLFMLFRTLNKPRKMTQQKLSKFQAKYNSASLTPEQRSIRLSNSSELGIAAALSQMLPNRDVVLQRLERTGLDITIGQYTIFSFVFSVIILLLTFIAGVPFLLAILLGIIAGIGLPHFLIGKIADSRIAKFTSQFPEAIDLMVRGLKSGLPVNETLISVGQEMAAPTGVEFKKLTDEVKFGKNLEDALWSTSKRLDTPDFKFFVISLSVQRETGGNLGETLENLSGILRSRQAMKLKIKALSSEAKASAWIVGLLPFIMYGIILAMNYEYGVILIEHATARLAAIGAMVWMAIGVFIMAKMIDFDV